MNLQHQYRIKKAIEVGSVQAILDIQYIEGVRCTDTQPINTSCSGSIER
jgi:hypothetical protein